MKHFFAALILLSGFAAQAQNSAVFCVQVNCPQTITAPKDSILIFGAATITGDSVISYQWKQVTGNPVTLVTPTSSQTMVRKLQPGTYVFSMTATTKAGNVQTISSDVVTVLPAPPPPRKVKAVTFQLVNGLWIPSITFDDGTTQ